MKSKYIFYVLAFWSLVSIGQTRIKVMTYNLMHFPSTLYYNESTSAFTDRTLVLKGILDTYQPDIFSVCELESSIGADMILQNALQTPDERYNRANFATNQSSNYDDLQQLVFYNSHKLTLVSQDIIITNIRDINYYSFQLNTREPIFLDVFVTHLKSSTGTDNEYKRLLMVEQFTNYLNQLPSNRHVIFTGDFNLYNSSEPAYQEILDITNAIVMVDPINSPGAWSNNYTFTDIHTQSPLTFNYQFKSGTGGSDGVTGGLDDRFDFIMVSQNTMSDPNLKYVPNSYKAYGNNGNCYNSYISNPDCSGTYSQELRNLLVNMSDHLPVVMEMETPETLGTNDLTQFNSIRFNSSNISYSQIELKISDNCLGQEFEIYNQMGQKMGTFIFEHSLQTVDISKYASGVYYLRSSISTKTPLRFIKM